MIELAFPYALLLLPVPWLVWRFGPPYRQRTSGLRVPFFRRLTEAAGLEARKGSAIVPRQPLQMVAVLLVWSILVLALARPERIGEPIEITKSARDLVLAVDISGSMDERDFRDATGTTFQRLEAVKSIVGDFIEARDGDRVALIVFGTRAFIQAPFTDDLVSVRALLEGTEVAMAGPHTAIGDAIGLSIRAFENSQVEDRLLILLSDGADTGSRMSPVNAAEIAASRGVEIHTIGVGSPDASGEARVDLVALEEIASRAGGRFFFAEDLDQLTDIYARIDEITPRRVEQLSFRPRQPLSSFLLGSAIGIILVVTLWLQYAAAGRAGRHQNKREGALR